MGRGFLAFVGCVAVMLVVALPATANNKPAFGPKLGVGPLAPTVFAADTAFHMEHGFACQLGDATCIGQGISHAAEFDLYLNGQLQPSTVDVDVIDGGISRQYLSNYRFGLPAGTYTFVGVWSFDGTVVLTETKTITFT